MIKYDLWETYGETRIILRPQETFKSFPVDRQPVKMVAQVMGMGLDQNYANARLIAAAPELYALASDLAGLSDEECMIAPLIHEARRIIALIDGGTDDGA